MVKGKVIKRNNFDNFWFECHPNPKFKKFNAIRVNEIDGMREDIKKALVEAIIDHHITPEKIDSREELKDLGYDITADLILDIPKSSRTKKGNFGEIISSEHLCQRYNYEMPVFKLRHSANPNVPMPGEDILAFNIVNDEIKTLCIGEAKVLTRYNSRTVNEAHERLDYTYEVRPTSLSLVYTALKDVDKKLAFELLKLMGTLGKHSFPRHNWIFIITDNKPRDPFKPISERSEIVENLSVISIHLPDLNKFIDEIFEKCVAEVKNV
ncbi:MULTISPECIES: Hachiman antiphage defense system protein HamA [Methanobacterium]|uniref:SAVED domain-containing protein n=1 Tax=Methanobacterium veterum TaxID=408577 RepID=A0A9E5A0C3_9EURY|nr:MULTISPECIES: Hachiman antiphage defense system protein HamA [Methanobacterium]MCZ3365675.1 SAVED domain-containing protein [Methanobacterium veterum]MCZ3371139.1 SAVED domain-containing protein [Methanobacterium veterum]